MARRGAALITIAVVALSCWGCSWVVLPDTRQNWADRLAAAENNLKQERLDIEKAGYAARENQLEFIRSIAAKDLEYAANEATGDRDQILQWSQSQSDATESIKDIEQDLALLRDEMSEEGF